jgi:hypothetical protein
MSAPQIHKLSDFLRNTHEAFCKDQVKSSLKIGEIIDDFKEQGYSILLFLFALPAALPLPGIGINIIIALPLLILTVQQAIGKQDLWFPKRMREKEISCKRFTGFLEKAIPYVEKVEIFSKPRLHFMTHGFSKRIIGLCGVIMALSICVPLPFTNTVPSFGIALMALGVLMRDGLAVLGGALIGVLWVTAISYMIFFFGTDGIDIMKDWIKSWI